MAKVNKRAITRFTPDPSSKDSSSKDSPSSPLTLSFNVDVKRRRRLLVWLYGWTMAILSWLRIVKPEKAYRRSAQFMVNNYYYRVGRKMDWRCLGSEVDVSVGWDEAKNELREVV